MPASAERACRIARREKSMDTAMRFAERAAIAFDPACHEATLLAVSELAENVLKYGERRPTAGTISIAVRGKVIRIRARNAASSPRNAKRAIAAVSKITESADVLELYKTRLQLLFDRPRTRRTQLGLLRLALEGGFRLSCSYRADVFEIVAERSCREAR